MGIVKRKQEFLREDFLLPLARSEYRVAKDIGVRPAASMKSSKVKRAVTADSALRFERYFGWPAEVWLNLPIPSRSTTRQGIHAGCLGENPALPSALKTIPRTVLCSIARTPSTDQIDSKEFVKPVGGAGSWSFGQKTTGAVVRSFALNKSIKQLNSCRSYQHRSPIAAPVSTVFLQSHEY